MKYLFLLLLLTGCAKKASAPNPLTDLGKCRVCTLDTDKTRICGSYKIPELAWEEAAKTFNKTPTAIYCRVTR